MRLPTSYGAKGKAINIQNKEAHDLLTSFSNNIRCDFDDSAVSINKIEYILQR